MILETCYILIWSSGILCLSTILYNLLRNYAFITSNCWFCNTNSKVPFKSRKEWFCMQCHQFNGFKADGDYSRILPEQFDETLNRKFTEPVFRKNEYVFNSNGLCSVCNANQELKIKQLALYVPFKEKNYDQEIEIFRNKLEKSYKLCEKCENFVNKKLQPKSNVGQFLNESKTDEIITNRCCSTSKYAVKSKLPVILVVVVGTLVACISKTKLFNKFVLADLLTDYDVNQVFQHGTSHLYCNIALDYIFAISSAFLPRIFLKRWTSVIGILLVMFSSMISDDLIPFWKSLAVFAVIIALVIKCIANKRSKRQNAVHKLDFNSPNRFDFEVEKNQEDELEKKFYTAKLNSSTSLYRNVPLCGQFSDMHLGKCEKYVSRLPGQSSPLSFKCDRLLIQPPKLKIDDPDHTDTLRTSTVSSGYQSLCGGLFKRTSDSDSEFDSISQVHIRTDNHSFNVSKTHSPSPRFMQQSQFHPSTALSLSGTECYYGAIPVYSSASARLSSSPSLDFSNDKSQLQINASIPTFQIALYSITCFVLGFSFQIFVREFFV